MYKRILVPVDGSETSNRALVAALQMARETSGRVRLLHAIDELAYLSAFEYSGQVLEAARKGGARTLEDAAAIATASGVPADHKLVEVTGQRLGEVVADEARNWDADLIVIGTHGRRGVSRVLLGSGAEQVLRLAPVPVLAVRTPEEAAST
ncbi:universal stress protein [Ramlibacter sp. AN1133]|uniref:universal stress protein n=1 Tax=Ramlibacter sp. AN1133 TaxID=3133429 RepID=UPI0030BF8205